MNLGDHVDESAATRHLAVENMVGVELAEELDRDGREKRR